MFTLILDGVLVDFVAGALKAHGRFIKPGDVKWDLEAQLAMSPADFWKPMGRRFWAELYWTAEGPHLLRNLEDRYGQSNIMIMTSPCANDGCLDGKMDWIKHHIPQYRRQFAICPSKHLAASRIIFWLTTTITTSENLKPMEDTDC